MINYFFVTTIDPPFLISHPNNPHPITSFSGPTSFQLLKLPLTVSDWEETQLGEFIRTQPQMEEYLSINTIPVESQFNPIMGFLKPNWRDYPDLEIGISSKGGLVAKFERDENVDIQIDLKNMKRQALKIFRRLIGYLNLFMTIRQPSLSDIFRVKYFIGIAPGFGPIGANSNNWSIGHTWMSPSEITEGTNLVALNEIYSATINYRPIHHLLLQSLLDRLIIPHNDIYFRILNLLSAAVKNYFDDDYISSYTLAWTAIEIFLKNKERNARQIRINNGESGVDITRINLGTILRRSPTDPNTILTNVSKFVFQKAYDIRKSVAHEAEDPTMYQTSKAIHLLKWLILYISHPDPNSIFRYDMNDFQLNPTGDWITADISNPRHLLHNDEVSPFYYWFNS